MLFAEKIVMKAGKLRIAALRALRYFAPLREIFKKCFKN